MPFLGLVAVGGVEGEVAQDFAGGGVADGDVEAVDEGFDGFPVVGAADADGVEGAAVAQGDLAVVDLVGPHPGVGSVWGFGGGGGFGPVGVGRGGGASVQGAVGPVVVVLAPEGVEEGLQVGQGRWLGGLPGEPGLQGLLEAFDFALGLGVVAAAVLLGDAEGGEFGLEGVAAAAYSPGGVADGVHHPVVGQSRCGAAVFVDGGAERGEHDRAGDSWVGGDV